MMTVLMIKKAPVIILMHSSAFRALLLTSIAYKHIIKNDLLVHRLGGMTLIYMVLVNRMR